MEEIMKYIQTELKGYYPDNEIQSFGYLLLEKITGFSRSEILINKNTKFSSEQWNKLNSFLFKLKEYVPIQYLLGETEFYGLNFLVNSSVLIPRPETEELIEWIVKENDKNSALQILDIGTGSGCIAISLKHEFPFANVDACDISHEAIETARLNAKINHTEIHFFEADILKNPLFDKKWDIIVSNPPYVPENEKETLLPNVLNYEPLLALFVPKDDPLLFYRNIVDFAQIHLNQGGKLYFEIHYKAGENIVTLLEQEGFQQIELKKDLSGNDRMIRAIYF